MQMNPRADSIIIYKISISIIFGVIGFFINFHTINFPFGQYTATVLIGLLFPMLITLTWGWKYGLLSAFAGGCQSMWLLWGPSNGYAAFFIVPPFTLWILWHGICADLRRKLKVTRWWLNIYIVEIPFRILSTINLYTLTRWAITLNPTPWAWGANVPNTVPMSFSNFVVIKQCIVGFIIILLADVLLNFKHVRRFFKLRDDYSQYKTGYIISASLLLGVLFWIIDSLFGAIAFYTESSFLELLVLNIPKYNVLVRITFIFACLICGLLVSRLLHKQYESTIALQESEIRFRELAELLPQTVFETDAAGNFTFVNRSALEAFGYTKNDLAEGLNALQMFIPEEQVRATENIRRRIEGEDLGITEFTAKRKDGSKFPVNMYVSTVVRDDRSVGFRGIIIDITERKRAEEERKQAEDQIKASLEEKGILLKEIHHRVKNNMQIITSLLSLQANQIEDKKAVELLKSSQNRVRSMALVHESLYKSEDLARIDFAEYIKGVITHLLNSYNVNPALIKSIIDVKDIYLGVDIAIPCALIINELISNSLKYAFPEGKEGQIEIDFNMDKNGKYTLIIGDDGVGLPKDIDHCNTDSLGLTLVNSLMIQLKGNIGLDRGKGTKYTITF